MNVKNREGSDLAPLGAPQRHPTAKLVSFGSDLKGRIRVIFVSKQEVLSVFSLEASKVIVKLMDISISVTNKGGQVVISSQALLGGGTIRIKGTSNQELSPINLLV